MYASGNSMQASVRSATVLHLVREILAACMPCTIALRICTIALRPCTIAFRPSTTALRSCKTALRHVTAVQQWVSTCTERSRSAEADVEAAASCALKSIMVSRDVLMSVNMLSSLLVN